KENKKNIDVDWKADIAIAMFGEKKIVKLLFQDGYHAPTPEADQLYKTMDKLFSIGKVVTTYDIYESEEE
ncbi:MAG: hypothetical protein GY940_27970, partial [bacterium]|nr:hypothetical protein [bacterium]